MLFAAVDRSNASRVCALVPALSVACFMHVMDGPTAAVAVDRAAALNPSESCLAAACLTGPRSSAPGYLFGRGTRWAVALYHRRRQGVPKLHRRKAFQVQRLSSTCYTPGRSWRGAVSE